MSEVTKASPAKIKRSGRGAFAGLVEAAFAEPGEWFAQNAEDFKRSNVYQVLGREVARAVAEIEVHGDKVYLRVKP